MIAGKPSHGPGAHEHNAGVLLLAKCLREGAGDLVEVKTHLNGEWPEADEITRADTILIYADGYSFHPAVQKDRLAQLAKEMKRGCGFVTLHWATEVLKDKGGAEFLEWMGGYCEPFWSVNPHWQADFTQLPIHPIANGVSPFTTHDEWYFHMRFKDGMKSVAPILSAIPPAGLKLPTACAPVMPTSAKKWRSAFPSTYPGRPNGPTVAAASASPADTTTRTGVMTTNEKWS
jgi:hypothetical protein